MKANLAALACRNIRSRRVRSWLTILGVLIGVMAVITLISIGTGVENAVLSQFKDVGLDIVLLTPRTGFATPQGGSQVGQADMASLSADGNEDVFSSLGDSEVLDTERLRGDVPAIIDIGQIATRILRVSAGSLRGYIRVIEPSYEFMDRFPVLLGGLELAEGGAPGGGSGEGILLGANVARMTDASVGDTIYIGGDAFAVAGILAPSVVAHEVFADMIAGEGGEIFTALSNVDNSVLIPFEVTTSLWGYVPASSMVAMRVRTGVSVSETIEEINAALVRQGAFMTPISTQALADNVQRTLGMVRTVLASIAAISLVVGAVGMMNTMYTAVLERTAEIGILKAIGAKDRQVLTIFLIDSGLMGVVGGLLGIVVGVAISLAGTSTFGQLLGVTTFSPAFPPWLISATLAASFVLGALAGAWPAWYASRMDPVEALRSS